MSLAVGLQEGASGVAFASGRSLVRAPGLYGKVQESVQAMAADVLTSTRDLGPALARSAPESREQASEGSLRVLAAGRAVLALCGGLLPIALGSPDQWAGAVGSRAGTRGRTVPARATSRTDPPAVGELRRVGASCVDAWAAVRGRPLGEGAAVDLIADPMLAWDGPMVSGGPHACLGRAAGMVAGARVQVSEQLCTEKFATSVRLRSPPMSRWSCALACLPACHRLHRRRPCGC